MKRIVERRKRERERDDGRGGSIQWDGERKVKVRNGDRDGGQV